MYANTSPSDTEQLYQELHRVIQRYSQESEITTLAVVGVLEAVKADVLDELKRWNEK